MDNQGEPAVFGIKDVLSTRFGNTLTGTFVSGNKIALSAYRPITCTTVDKPTEYNEKDPVQIHLLQPTFIFEDPILRSLIAEGCATFVALQRLKRAGSKSDYIKISRTYRSIIRACLEKLQDAALIDEEEKYQRYISTFYPIECIWHLCEILYLDVNSNNLISPQLLDWIRFHFPTGERLATDLLLLGREASDNKNYWPTLKSLITQGQIEVARALLHLHPLIDSPTYQLADQILRAIPNCNIHSGFSVQKFRAQWQYWLTDTEQKLSSNILAGEPKLEEIIQLITCNTDVWNAEIKNAEYWYELFPGFLFYSNPTCKLFELGNIANNWLDRFAQQKHINSRSLLLNQLDQIILSLMENNLHEVIHETQLLADNQWFITHLCDLLYNSGNLENMGNQRISECVKLRHSLVYEFGTCLMTRNSLWQLGIDYLDYCSHEGKVAQELLLTKVVIKSEKQALKVIGIARKLGFIDAEQQICKIEAKKSFSIKRYGNALEWAIRSKDNIFVTSIADFILKNYGETGDMVCPDIVANIGPKMFISPRLVFLVKYFDFYQFYRKRNFLPAAELLVNLLDSKITPEYFWPSLLIDTIPLLESKDPKILSKETCAILYHLESELVPLIEKKKKRLEKFPNMKTQLQ
ncbi:nuclear pore complex protein Nup75-like [Teleopsis dalmanni]|uniref:nuclear pore complex protein Nup75-like n=1 Tax=Teleopsis dalmanni TaxID=139649 RepID=UPI0018CEA2C5|nr:nuclear pore complex protein Nup75-like [Teleopsis dalmanni]